MPSAHGLTQQPFDQERGSKLGFSGQHCQRAEIVTGRLKTAVTLRYMGFAHTLDQALNNSRNLPARRENARTAPHPTDTGRSKRSGPRGSTARPTATSWRPQRTQNRVTDQTTKNSLFVSMLVCLLVSCGQPTALAKRKMGKAQRSSPPDSVALNSGHELATAPPATRRTIGQ